MYNGMRWLKCNLHMHTPVDSKNWIGDAYRDEEQEKMADDFAEACYSQHFDVIAVTDHNFITGEFITVLQSAFENIKQKYNHKIFMFLGFEIEAAGVGRGAHVICIFDPQTPLEKIKSVLHQCGVAYPLVQDDGTFSKSDKNLKDILRIVQDQNNGLVILPHCLSNDGIFDNNSISEWLQKDQFTNPKLLAVEVPKPVNKMNEAFQKLLLSKDDCLEEWRRIRPIATILSSDSKKLIEIDENGRPTANSIGYRYSWIKMSQPSIESLRQAFLDHESRIILPDDVVSDIHPANRVRQAKICSIKVKGVAFLADQKIQFSPNMNCIIGGRGSGKSTLLEYLRIGFNKDNSSDIDDETRKRIERVRGTLIDSSSEIDIHWSSEAGVDDIIRLKDGELFVEGQELVDPDTYFSGLPIKFYSQQQLNHLTESNSDLANDFQQAQSLLVLIDGFNKIELNDLFDTEKRITYSIMNGFSDAHRVEGLEKTKKRLEQEFQEIDRQRKARSEIQEDANKHQLLKAESRYLNSVLGLEGKRFEDVSALANLAAESHVPFDVKDSPHSEWLEHFDSVIKDAKKELSKIITEAIDKFEISINELKEKDPSWKLIKTELDEADKKFQEACAEKGLSPDDVGRLKEINYAREEKQKEIDDIVISIEETSKSATNPEELIQELHEIWLNEYEKRQEAVRKANELAILNEGNQKFIEVSVKYQQDYKSFFELWEGFAPSDRRTRLGRNWEDCGVALFSFFKQNKKAKSPWQEVIEILSDTKTAKSVFDDNVNDINKHIKENQESWEKLRCSRVQDTVDMKLFRSDGTVAGSIADGSLSDGQRNTAALAILLAQEGGPLIIDQPEDELDSNFVFNDLIPVLRSVKIRRQIIIATHNANLPVNGDAELIYAFVAQNGKGEVQANGGLDQCDVTKAVLDIMEGTEEAFRRRREKYNF